MNDQTERRTSWPSREELIAICEAAVVPHDKWRNRDTAQSQTKLGTAWALLRAGCEFTFEDDMRDFGEDTWWIRIYWNDFNRFEWGDEVEQADELFYLPTRERLERRAGDDWY